MKKWIIIILSLLLLIMAGIGVAGYIGFKALEKRVKNAAVWIEDLETGNVTRLGSVNEMRFPCFAPDGENILFLNENESGNYSICTVNHQDKNTDVLIQDTGFCKYLAWHPDGTSIYYVVNTDSQPDIWKYDLKSHSKVQITNDPHQELRLQPSPDGKWIMFLQESIDEHDELYIIPSDGGEKHRLTQTKNMLHEIKMAAWTPDSNEIAYMSFLNLIIISRDGDIVNTISLAGLNNFGDVFFQPDSSNSVLVKARSADDTSMKFKIYKISRRTKHVEIWKSDRSIMENSYQISSDGKYMIFRK